MTIFSRMSGLGALAALALVLAATLTTTGPASAQGVFCPTRTVSAPSPVNSVPNIALTSGNCTNPAIAGAFSGAALASQAIGDLAGSSTIPETSVAVQAIEERRAAPVEPCPAGTVLVDGICKAPVAPAPMTPVAGVEPAPIPTVVEAPAGAPPAPAVSAKGAKAHARRTPAPAAPLPTHKAMAPALVDQSLRIGAWAQGFGDYEHRTGSRNTIIDCCTSQPSNTNITPLLLEATSNTTSGGFVGGIDGTKRGLWSAQDGITFGLLGGYTWTKISLTTTAVSTKPNLTASGASWTDAHINGPSLGGYLSYFNGPLANDFLIKDDFLSLSETGSQLLGFGACSCYVPPAPSFVVPQYGTGSTNLNQLTISDDVTYKIPLSGFWIAPTAGLRYVNSTYSSSAQALGLDDGYIFRVQGGAKVGMESLFNSMRVTTVLTGLIFSDVVVHGNNIQGGSFGQDGRILNDEGRVQGQGIAMVNVDFGHGMSASLQGDIYGSKDIFGAGGRATVRMTW